MLGLSLALCSWKDPVPRGISDREGRHWSLLASTGTSVCIHTHRHTTYTFTDTIKKGKEKEKVSVRSMGGSLLLLFYWMTHCQSAFQISILIATDQCCLSLGQRGFSLQCSTVNVATHHWPSVLRITIY